MVDNKNTHKQTMQTGEGRRHKRHTHIAEMKGKVTWVNPDKPSSTPTAREYSCTLGMQGAYKNSKHNASTSQTLVFNATSTDSLF